MGFGMRHFRIVELYDDSDCEYCGPTFAMGYEVYEGDKLVLDYAPSASCTQIEHYEWTDMLEGLGYLLNVTFEFDKDNL